MEWKGETDEKGINYFLKILLGSNTYLVKGRVLQTVHTVVHGSNLTMRDGSKENISKSRRSFKQYSAIRFHHLNISSSFSAV